MKREEFMDLVYDELNDDPDNNRANRIILAADQYAEESEPSLEQVELYCKRRCLTVITDEMLAKLIEERDSIQAGAIPVAWINAKIESMKGTDNKLAELTADVMATAMDKWRKELEGKTT